MLNYDLDNRQKEFELLDAELHGDTNLVNPFPGLRPFGVDECHLFFGREGQVDEVLVKLAENRFVTVLGYSGSGKSSLMYCGIIPILYGGFMTETGADWNIVVTRPGYSPLDNLAESLIQHDPAYANATEEDRLIKRTVAAAILRGGSSGLIDIARQYKTLTGDNLFILIDQFEEVFRFKESDPEAAEEAAAFIRLILEAVESEDVPIYVAVTMRSDYMGESAHYPGLTELINKSSYVIPQMTREQKRMAIEGPIAVGGGRIAPRLVKRLLKEIGDNQDQLPIMQHALMRTWDYWVENREKGEEIDFRHYNAVGRIDEALSQHADEAYEQLSANHKRVAEVLFKSLTEKGSDAYGLRRPSTIREVARVANVDESMVIEVVEHFRQPGLSLLMPPANVELYSDTIIEISHESLMRIWTRLKNWVDEEDESAQMYLRISEAAALYQIGRTGLWRPPDLQLALNWQKKQNPTRFWAQRYDEAFERAIVFLDTSRITYESEQESQELLQKRMLRRARSFATILGVAAIIAIILAIMSMIWRADAESQRELAESRRIVAEEATAAAKEAQAEAEVAKELAEQRLLEVRDANRQVVEANRNLQTALANEKISKAAAVAAQKEAEIQKNIALAARDQADSARRIAELRTIEKDNLFKLSLATALAGKSLRERDADLRANMALQAYKYNAEFGGEEFNIYIYDALYYALATFEGPEYNMFNGHSGAVKSIAFRGNDNRFFSTGSDGKIYQWQLQDNTQPPVVIAGSNAQHPNRELKVSPDKKWLLSTSDSSTMQLYNLQNLAAAPVIITGHRGFVRDAEFLPNNAGIISVGADGTLVMYDFKRSRVMPQMNYPVNRFAIDPQSKYIYAGTKDGKLVRISIADMSKQELLLETGAANRINALTISADGRYLAMGGDDKYVILYDLANETVVDELYGHEARVNDLAFSHNGKRLASASWDHTVQMWNLENLDDIPYYFVDNGNSFVWDLAFSPGDDYLVVGTKDGKIKKWAVDNATMAGDICGHVTRNMTKDEWARYVSDEVEYEYTCENLLNKDNS